MYKLANNTLAWDCTHLGTGILIQQWTSEHIQYYNIQLTTGDFLYCTGHTAKDVFPCIVEDVKAVFGLPKRGIHRITLDGREHILYYVPISTKGDVIWETPLNRIDSKHGLRKDQEFRKEIQKLVCFRDIMALTNTGEPSIRLRPGTHNTYIPISVNETHTTITKETLYDSSVLTKRLFWKWFGEDTAMGDIVRNLICYHSTDPTELAIIASEIRSKIEAIIKRYDRNYIWYSYFCVDRLLRLIDV